MYIDENGYKLFTLNEIKHAYEVELQKLLGADFCIKPDSTADNLITAFALHELILQTQIAYICSQFNPETVSGVFQDAMYERIGVCRIKATPTVFKIKIIGKGGFSGKAETIVISSGNNEFSNSTDYTLNDSGEADIEFQGEALVNPDDIFQIIQAPNEITALSGKAYDIVAGHDEESDDDYRLRFKNSKAINSKATRNANLANLSKYVDNIAFLKIIDKKDDNTFAAGTAQIIAKHNTTDEIFAKAIFDSAADGIEYTGNTTVIVKDNSGEDLEIKFEKALEPEISIKGTLKLKQGYSMAGTRASAEAKIREYITERVFGLGSIIYATEFIVPILEADGVEAVLDIAVKKEDGEYTDSVTLARNEAPKFQEIVLLEGG